jgi:hypothetical protein
VTEERDPIARIDARLERMETKIDQVLGFKATVDYIKLAVAGAYAGLLALFLSHK